MKIRFKRTVTVDFEDHRYGDILESKSFTNGQFLVNVSNIEKMSDNFSNLIFDNGDIAIDVPNNSFEIC